MSMISQPNNSKQAGGTRSRGASIPFHSILSAQTMASSRFSASGLGFFLLLPLFLSDLDPFLPLSLFFPLSLFSSALFHTANIHSLCPLTQKRREREPGRWTHARLQASLSLPLSLLILSSSSSMTNGSANSVMRRPKKGASLSSPRRCPFSYLPSLTLAFTRSEEMKEEKRERKFAGDDQTRSLLTRRTEPGFH